MLKMLDLFAGLGGASEAFVNHPGWNVWRVDNNQLLCMERCMVIMDIKHPDQFDHMNEFGNHFDLIWASPPCTNFSLANPKRNPDLGLPLVQTTIDIIGALKPTCWIIENVIGSIKHLAPLLGPPRLILGPYVFWGNFPLFWVNMEGYKKDTSKYGPSDPLRTQKRAYIPIQISEALLKALDTQTRFNVDASCRGPYGWQYVHDSSIE